MQGIRQQKKFQFYFVISVGKDKCGRIKHENRIYTITRNLIIIIGKLFCWTTSRCEAIYKPLLVTVNPIIERILGTSDMLRNSVSLTYYLLYKHSVGYEV